MALIVCPPATASIYFCSNNRYSIIRVYSFNKNSLFCSTKPIIYWPPPLLLLFPILEELRTSVEARFGMSMSAKSLSRTSFRKVLTTGSSMGTFDAVARVSATCWYPYCVKYCWMMRSISSLCSLLRLTISFVWPTAPWWFNIPPR